MIQFRDEGAGSFMLDWMRDQADLFMREGDPTLELPALISPGRTIGEQCNDNPRGYTRRHS